MSDGQPRSVSSSHNIIIKTPLPPEPPDGEPPKEALKTPELSSQVSSSILSRQSSANTTPRQNNRRVFEDRNVPTKPSSNSIVADIPAEVLSSHPRHPPLPSPKHHSNCHLLCCFYAEFDIKVGPKICYQSPANFMEQDIRLPVQQMEKLLAKTFHVDSISPEQSPMAGIPKATTSDGQLEKMEDGDDDSPLLSIFDSCSEYIITGNELTGNIISLSTHNIHVLTRPTSIADEKYERNSLLFCVGFVLRRTEDPRPFRPVLSKLALTLRDMEVESQFLSQSRPQIQSLLEGILVSLNSEACECNMLLGKADFLNLKLFRPPKTPARLVKDHEVPILLRQDWQVQAYDWDLSINWVSLHIDGIKNARQISRKAEVDLEMVRACLRVLKQHGVVALVDMFCYSNRYECTEKAANLFSRECEDKLLFDAVEFVVRRRSFTGNASAEPANLHSTSPLTISQRHDLSLNQRLSCSFPSELTFKEGNAHRLAAGAYSHQELPLASVLKGEDYTEVKTAVAEFFCACNRGIPIGELWIVLVSKRFPPGTSSRVDWKKACRCIDHRRLITFGLVHGLISRVHNFPLLLAGKFSESPAEGDYAPDFQLSHSSLDRTRPMIQQHGKSDHQEERRKLANRAAHMMDGMRCDDDLVCALSLPLHEIFALFPDRRIVSVFATG